MRFCTSPCPWRSDWSRFLRCGSLASAGLAGFSGLSLHVCLHPNILRSSIKIETSCAVGAPLRMTFQSDEVVENLLISWLFRRLADADKQLHACRSHVHSSFPSNLSPSSCSMAVSFIVI